MATVTPARPNFSLLKPVEPFVCESPWKFLWNSKPVIWRRVARHIEHHPALSTGAVRVCFNTCVVASRLFPQIPQWIGHAATACLSTSGILWLNSYLIEIRKGQKDFYLALQSRDGMGMLLSAIKVSQNVADLGLTCAVVGASIYALIGLSETALVIYAVLRPIGLASLAAAIGQDIANYYYNGQLLQRFKVFEEDTAKEAKIRALFRSIVAVATPEIKGFSNSSKENKRMAVQMLRHSDAYLAGRLQEELRKAEQTLQNYLKNGEKDTIPEEFLRTWQGKISYDRKDAEANLVFRALGYFCFGLTQLYRGTLLESLVSWTLCSLWTGKYAIEAYHKESVGYHWQRDLRNSE